VEPSVLADCTVLGSVYASWHEDTGQIPRFAQGDGPWGVLGLCVAQDDSAWQPWWARWVPRTLHEGAWVRVVLTMQEGTVMGEADEPDRYFVRIDAIPCTFQVDELPGAARVHPTVGKSSYTAQTAAEPGVRPAACALLGMLANRQCPQRRTCLTNCDSSDMLWMHDDLGSAKVASGQRLAAVTLW
jgi:hypothetical protein